MPENCRSISLEAAIQYQQGWTVANRRLTEELRATSMETKLDRLASLMASARDMGWAQSHVSEDDAVRERWMALRRTQLGKA